MNAQVTEVGLFPAKCFLLNVSEYGQILNECLENREQIKKASKAAERTWHENHFSDYSNTVENKAFEEAIQKALVTLHNSTGLGVGFTEYWTAFYGNGAMHEPHVHNVSVFDKVNYSGVLYLTEGGGTTFFSPHSMSDNASSSTEGRPGDLFIFPASLPHTFHKRGDSIEERVVMSFNLHLYGEIND